jgi:C4-dicarboxylate-specific signal transduction histidine kinase
LQQVLLNLIMNAVEAMSSITDRERILAVQSRVCEPAHVLITVEDSKAAHEHSTQANNKSQQHK